MSDTTFSYFFGVVVGAYVAIAAAALGNPLKWYSPLIWIVVWTLAALIIAGIRALVRRIRNRRTA